MSDVKKLLAGIQENVERIEAVAEAQGLLIDNYHAVGEKMLRKLDAIWLLCHSERHRGSYLAQEILEVIDGDKVAPR